MNKLGPHIHRPGMGMDLLGRWKPALATLMDVNADQIREARRRSLLTHYHVRVWEGEGRNWRNVSPEMRASQILDAIDPYRPQPGEPFTVGFFNEALGHDARYEWAEYDRRLELFIQIMRGYGIEVAGLSLPEGNWTKDGPNIMDSFPRSLSLLKFIDVHMYGWPSMRAPGMVGYHTMRWPYLLADLEAAGLGHIRVIISECGLTKAVAQFGNDVGWLVGLDSGEVTIEGYIDDWSWVNSQLVQDDRMVGAAIFNFYPNPPFGSFAHMDHPQVVDRIMAIDAPVEIPEEPEPPPTPPEPPSNGGDEMKIRVVDLNYQEQDLQYAEAKYGVGFRRAQVEPGQKVYRLIELWEKEGNSSLITQVLDEDGQPVAGVDVAFYWPDAPDPPDPFTEVYAHDWYRKFTHGPTSGDKGEVGPGMGKGAYYDPKTEQGPHKVWVRDPDIPSDICENLGMLALTAHIHLDQKFKLMVQGAGPGPEPPPLGELVHVDTIRNEHTAAQIGIMWPADDEAFDDNIRGGFLRDDGREHWLDTAEPRRIDWQGRKWGFGYLCADFAGTEPRNYFIEVHEMTGSQPRRGPRMTEVFNPVPDYREVIFVLDYSGDGNGGNGGDDGGNGGDGGESGDVAELREDFEEFKDIIADEFEDLLQRLREDN